MKTPRYLRSPRPLRLLLLVPLVALGLIAPPAHAAAPSALHAGPAAPSSVLADAIPPICESDLPSEAHDTIALIRQGGPFPYPQDGSVFQNREGLLPDAQLGYYHEYTVETPGSSDRGARRIVTAGYRGADGMYYTSDHYASFSDIDFSC